MLKNIKANNTISGSALINVTGWLITVDFFRPKKSIADISFSKPERSNLNRRNHNQEQCQCRIVKFIFNNITYFTEFKAVICVFYVRTNICGIAVFCHLRIHITRRWPLSLRERWFICFPMPLASIENKDRAISVPLISIKIMLNLTLRRQGNRIHQ